MTLRPGPVDAVAEPGGRYAVATPPRGPAGCIRSRLFGKPRRLWAARLAPRAPAAVACPPARPIPIAAPARIGVAPVTAPAAPWVSRAAPLPMPPSARIAMYPENGDADPPAPRPVMFSSRPRIRNPTMKVARFSRPTMKNP